MSAVRSDVLVPVTLDSAEGSRSYRLSVRLVAPTTPLPGRPLVFFCFPGGGFAKEYFDLDPGGPDGFSFAEAMAARGHVSVLVDHLGVGASEAPADGFELHPDRVAAANVQAVRHVGERLTQGALGLPPLPAFTGIGVGHSMGGMLTAIAQAREAPFAAVAILGSGPYGYREILPAPLLPLADDPERARREIVPRMRDAGLTVHVAPVPPEQAPLLFDGVPADGLRVMLPTRTRLIRVCGLFAVIPRAWAPDAAGIAQPVLRAYGDRDLRRDLSGIMAYFSRASSLRQLTLPQTGHMHFAFPSRRALFAEIAAWAEQVSGG
jgi:pimeloyl-ACP methyl ester carboxylesterase